MTRYLEGLDEMPSFPSISGTQSCANVDLDALVARGQCLTPSEVMAMVTE